MSDYFLLNEYSEREFFFFLFFLIKKIAVIGKKLLKGRSLTVPTHSPFCLRRHWLKLEKENVRYIERVF